MQSVSCLLMFQCWFKIEFKNLILPSRFASPVPPASPIESTISRHRATTWATESPGVPIDRSSHGGSKRLRHCATALKSAPPCYSPYQPNTGQNSTPLAPGNDE